jgi:hypothetical protein
MVWMLLMYDGLNQICITPPATLQETLRNPNPRKEAHHIQREMQWCDKLMY